MNDVKGYEFLTFKEKGKVKDELYRMLNMFKAQAHEQKDLKSFFHITKQINRIKIILNKIKRIELEEYKTVNYFHSNNLF